MPGTITLALSKGRIFDDCLPLLTAAGIAVTEDPEKSRKLILGTSLPGVRVVLVRPSDVPTYVEHGGADLGVVGLDTLLEHSDDLSACGLYVPVDLKIARCRISVATRADFDYAAAVAQRNAGGVEGAVDAQQLVRGVVSRYREQSCSAFLDAYRLAANGLPHEWHKRDGEGAALDLFCLEKAAYEITYEAENRPSWLAVPLHGLHGLISTWGES